MNNTNRISSGLLIGFLALSLFGGRQDFGFNDRTVCPLSSTRSLRAMSGEGSGLEEELRKRLSNPHSAPTTELGEDWSSHFEWTMRIGREMVLWSREGQPREIARIKLGNVQGNKATLQFKGLPTVLFAEGEVWKRIEQQAKQSPGGFGNPWIRDQISGLLEEQKKAQDQSEWFSMTRLEGGWLVIFNTDPRSPERLARVRVLEFPSRPNRGRLRFYPTDKVRIDESNRYEAARQRFQSRPDAGLEEGDFLEKLVPLYQQAMEAMKQIDQKKEGGWMKLEDILDEVDRLQRPADIRQNQDARFRLDQLEIFRLEMSLSRYLPESWQVGNDIPTLAEDDLRSVLSQGDSLLKEEPPPNPRYHRRQVKTFQAKAAMILAVADRYDDEEAEKIITDSDVPRGNAAAFLHQLWWARFVRDKGRRRWPNLPHPAHTKALAYGLIDAMTPEDQYLHPNDYEEAPDSLLQFLQEEKGFTPEMLKQRREAVFDVVKENLWEIGQEGPGPIPQEMIQEALSPNPSESTLLRLAIASSDALIRVDGKLGGRKAAAPFGKLAQELKKRLADLGESSISLRVPGFQISRSPKERDLGGPFTSSSAVVAWIEEHLIQAKTRPDVDADWIRLDFLSSEFVPTRWVDLRETERSPIQKRLNRLRRLMEENNPDPRAHPFYIVASWSVQPRGEKGRFIPVWEVALTTREAPASDQPSHLDLEGESLSPSTPWEGRVLSYEEARQVANDRLSLTLDGDNVQFFRIPPGQWVELTADELEGGMRVLYQYNKGEKDSSKYVRVALVGSVEGAKVPWMIAVEERKPGESESLIHFLPLKERGAQLSLNQYGVVLQVEGLAKQAVLIRLSDPNRPVYLEVRPQTGLEEGPKRLQVQVELDPETLSRMESGLRGLIEDFIVPEMSKIVTPEGEESIPLPDRLKARFVELTEGLPPEPKELLDSIFRWDGKKDPWIELLRWINVYLLLPQNAALYPVRENGSFYLRLIPAIGYQLWKVPESQIAVPIAFISPDAGGPQAGGWSVVGMGFVRVRRDKNKISATRFEELSHAVDFLRKRNKGKEGLPKNLEGVYRLFGLQPEASLRSFVQSYPKDPMFAEEIVLDARVLLRFLTGPYRSRIYRYFSGKMGLSDRKTPREIRDLGNSIWGAEFDSSQDPWQLRGKRVFTSQEIHRLAWVKDAPLMRDFPKPAAGAADLAQEWFREAIRRQIQEKEGPSPPTAGLEVAIYDGLVKKGTAQVAKDPFIQKGLVEPGLSGPVAALREPRFERFFYRRDLAVSNFAGLEEIPLPEDPVEASGFLKKSGIQDFELILLPAESVAVGLEERYRPAGSRAAIVVIPSALAPELTPRHLETMAAIARQLNGVFRAGLEEWRQGEVEGVEYLGFQS